MILCLNSNLEWYRPWCHDESSLVCSPSLPNSQQESSHSPTRDIPTICASWDVSVSSHLHRQIQRLYPAEGPKEELVGSQKETNNTPLTLGLNTHTQLLRTYNMDKHLFCVFLRSHLSGLQKDAYWNKTERVPRWLMLCFGSDVLKGKIVWFTLFLIQNYDFISSPSYHQNWRGYYFSITHKCKSTALLWKWALPVQRDSSSRLCLYIVTD